MIDFGYMADLGYNRPREDPENELGGGQFRGSGGQMSPISGVQGRSPVGGVRDEVPPEADDFSQLKASWGAACPPPLAPLKSASVMDLSYIGLTP